MSKGGNLSVLHYLHRAANRPKAPSALDAVMGEDWAVYEATSPRKALQIQFLVNQQRNRRAAGAGLAFRVGRQSPQAMVKMIHKGGAQNAAGLKAQMEYLEKGGTVVLRRSDALLGAEVDAGQKDLMADAWGLKAGKETSYPMTSHFVVSFPIGTDPEAAARAGRAWAEEMFNSGRIGDRYDYYTADHRDTAHPHTHVVVSRRGLDNGYWLKVSRRSVINYDSMRELQVEVASREGITLEATPRLARGVHERVMPDARLRAEREGRGGRAKPPEHTEVSAIAAAATIIEFSRQIDRERQLAQVSSEVDETLKTIVRLLREGHQITARQARSRKAKELKTMSERYLAKRAAIVQSFADMDRDVATVEDPQKRVALERQTADLKREAAMLLPDNKELAAFAATRGDRSYQGLRSEGGNEGEGAEAARVRAETISKVRRIASDTGLDPDEVVARYGTDRVSEGLAARWRREELRQLAEARGGQGPHDEADLTKAHGEIRETYRAAQRRLDGLRAGLTEEDQRDFEALEKRLARTDFNYGYSDDPRSRDAGREEVKAATEAFTAFASRSRGHAAMASGAWDEAADQEKRPEGYIEKRERSMPEREGDQRASMEARSIVSAEIDQPSIDRMAARVRKELMAENTDGETFNARYDRVERLTVSGKLDEMARKRIESEREAFLQRNPELQREATVPYTDEPFQERIVDPSRAAHIVSEVNRVTEGKGPATRVKDAVAEDFKARYPDMPDHLARGLGRTYEKTAELSDEAAIREAPSRQTERSEAEARERERVDQQRRDMAGQLDRSEAERRRRKEAERHEDGKDDGSAPERGRGRGRDDDGFGL